jgi:predicted glycogen debranching enzyme
MLDFGRDVCGYLPLAERREWLITNGIGGYGCGTVAGLLTRRYHGLLIAALDPPLGRALLLTKLDEIATYDGRDYSLFANRWAEGGVEPAGFRHLERFHLEGTTPVWTFACADALLEKRVWMEPGANTTYVRYDLARGSAPITLSIKAMTNYRDHHGSTHAGDWRMRVESVADGLRVVPFDGAAPLHVLSKGAEVVTDHTWYRGYFLAMEDYRGLDAQDDNLHAGRFHAELQPDQSLLIVASTEAAPDLDHTAAYDRRRAHERRLLKQSDVPGSSNDAHTDALPWEQHLILAADQFVVRRSLPEDTVGRTIIAGYPWFGDWGRDTMISLPGLTLVTGRHDVAERILRTFAHFVDRGMLPNRFPDEGQRPEYNTVDATLWYVEALRAYHDGTDDDDLLHHLFPVLQQIISWHERGTRYGIRVDPDDGLLTAGEPGVQLTWMDARVGDWVVTPRIGKPVEINALWYNALRIMADFARQLEEPAGRYEILTESARSGFARFWNEDVGYCYDVLDGPDGDDPALRPNQLFAVSLPYSPLSGKQQKAVVDACARHLLTSHGLRSLSPNDPAYVGQYGGDQRQRDAAYHQGTAWAWLIGPFVMAHLRIYGDPEQARSFLEPFVHHLGDHGVGSVSEIFDGDPPFAPRGCVAQAWSVAEMLRAWSTVKDLDGGKESAPKHVNR